jgi:hypothetical protein
LTRALADAMERSGIAADTERARHRVELSMVFYSLRESVSCGVACVWRIGHAAVCRLFHRGRVGHLWGLKCAINHRA